MTTPVRLPSSSVFFCRSGTKLEARAAARRVSPPLPRGFGALALALGIAFEIAGFVGLFTTPTLTLVVLGGQSLWVVAAALALLLRAGQPAANDGSHAW